MAINKPKPESGFKYHRQVDVGFLRFANAYKGDDRKDDYTRKRFRFESIVSYEAWDWDNYNDASYESKKKKEDLGNTAYCIHLMCAQGDHSSQERIMFYTEQQRDETLDQLDFFMGLNETTVQPRITVINPRLNKIPEGSAIIQDLPTLA